MKESMDQDFTDHLPESSPPAKPSQNSTLTIVMVGISVVGMLAVVACCGAGAWFVSFGLDVVAAEVEDDLRNNEVVREHVGEIQEFEMHKAKSIAHDDEDVFVYRVSGTLGEGWIEAISEADELGKEVVVSGKLRMEDGEEYDLFPH